MRPGRERPGKRRRRGRPDAIPAGFNEAGARTPRKAEGVRLRELASAAGAGASMRPGRERPGKVALVRVDLRKCRAVRSPLQ